MSSNQRLSFLRCKLSGYQLLLTLLNFPIGMKKCLVTARKRSLSKQESPLFNQERNKVNFDDFGSQGMKMNILGRTFGWNELKKKPPEPESSAQRKEKVPGKFNIIFFKFTLEKKGNLLQPISVISIDFSYRFEYTTSRVQIRA